MKVKCKAITFDLWFTLIWLDDKIYREYTNNRVKSIYDTLSKYFKNISWNDVLAAYNETSNLRMLAHPSKVISTILQKLNVKLNEEEFNRLVNNYIRASESVLPYLNVEAPNVLNKLWEKGVRLGIITTTSFTSNSLWKILDRLSISKYFKVIVSSCEVGIAKPNPEIFNLTLKLLGVDKSETIHVGDNYDDDIVGAKNVGITPVLYRGLWSKYRSYPRATWRRYDKDSSIIIIDNLNQLLSLI